MTKKQDKKTLFYYFKITEYKIYYVKFWKKWKLLSVNLFLLGLHEL